MELRQLLRNLIIPNKPWLFKKQIHDDLFGMIWFNIHKKQPEYDHYQGHLTFKPTNMEIDIFFDSDPEGIASDQKTVFKTLENNYHDYISKLLRPMQYSIVKRKSKDIVIKDFNTEFQLFGLSIPRLKSRHKDVTLSFISDTHAIPNINATFRNGELLNIE